ncbi:MAG TPA: hypothetical protein VKT75_11170 [Acidobacteriaceae bacterium]|nr:hypothetical protein [Acidobacteriaceae bacterium]
MSTFRRSSLIQALRRTLRSIEDREKLTPEDATLRELKRSIVQTLAELDAREDGEHRSQAEEKA